MALASRSVGARVPASDDSPVEVFVGPPGVGKTTTIAKIAAQERARRGRKLGLVAADGFRIGAVEQLRMFADIIGAPFKIARTADRPRGGAVGRPPAAGAGRHGRPFAAGRSAARDLLAGARPPHRCAHASGAGGGHLGRSARRIFDAYEEARPTRLVLTKLDEAGSLSPLVGLLRERQLPISYLGTGQHVPEDLTRATAQLLAASVLGESKPSTHLHVIGIAPMRMNPATRHTTRAVERRRQLADRNQLVMDNIGLVKALALRMARRVPTQVEVSELDERRHGRAD